jgi:hypothetical protein
VTEEERKDALIQWLTSDGMRDYFRRAMARDLKDAENTTIDKMIEKGIIVLEEKKDGRGLK